MPHNVEQVIADIDDVKDDLHDETKRSARGSMEAVHDTAVENVMSDADWTGNLRRSLGVTMRDRGDHISVSVETDASIAPYAPFVELGTGRRTLQTAPQAASAAPRTPEEAPPDFPYSSPGRVTSGLVRNIIEWVETKPVKSAEFDSDEALGIAIAATIVEEGTYAHPFLQPAWFQHELLIRQNMRNAVQRAFS